MPLYQNDLQSNRQQWIPSATMNASIVLDQPANTTFTNLDQISGKVVLKCAKSTDLDRIVVKLEGESRTRLLSVAAAGEKQRPRLEYHKVSLLLLFATRSIDVSRPMSLPHWSIKLLARHSLKSRS